MKYLLALFGVIAIVCGMVFFRNDVKTKDEYVRVHITANSNSGRDENIKYVVKDAVVEYLIPYLSQAENSEKAQEILKQELTNVEMVTNQILKSQGANYVAKISLVPEDYPTRNYDGLVLESGVYDSLKIDLGEAKGDNWWCVVFPAVCFVSSKNPENIEYISKIWEIINNVKNREEK